MSAFICSATSGMICVAIAAAQWSLVILAHRVSLLLRRIRLMLDWVALRDLMMPLSYLSSRKRVSSLLTSYMHWMRY